MTPQLKHTLNEAISDLPMIDPSDPETFRTARIDYNLNSGVLLMSEPPDDAAEQLLAYYRAKLIEAGLDEEELPWLFASSYNLRLSEYFEHAL